MIALIYVLAFLGTFFITQLLIGVTIGVDGWYEDYFFYKILTKRKNKRKPVEKPKEIKFPCMDNNIWDDNLNKDDKWLKSA